MRTTQTTQTTRTARAGRVWLWRLVGTVLLGLSLLGSALPARAAMAAGPVGGRGAAARVGRVAQSSALPAGLAPVLRRALGLRAVAVGSRQGLLEPATTWSQQAEITATDGASGNKFGFSVAVSGSTALVGAPYQTVYGFSGAGAAYVFVRSGHTWSQQAKLTALDAEPGGNFGVSVALSGNTALVGAPGWDITSGAAYVFVRSGTAWSQQAELTDPPTMVVGDYFGWSVALSRDTALVGTPFKFNNVGAAYVFVRSGTAWSQQAELDNPCHCTLPDSFGVSVALSGGTALIGAGATNSATGAAYVFVRSGSTWSQQQELTASDGAAGDVFGWSVALSGNTALVGAWGKNFNAGTAYVFVRSGTTWSQQFELTASDGAASDYFGYAVALSGTTALVGASYKSTGAGSLAGAAYVFVRSGSTLTQQAELTASDAASGDQFGNAVALSGNTALVGAPFKTVNGASQAGAAYVFVRS